MLSAPGTSRSGLAPTRRPAGKAPAQESTRYPHHRPLPFRPAFPYMLQASPKARIPMTAPATTPPLVQDLHTIPRKQT
jgi:hypothetical protein